MHFIQQPLQELQSVVLLGALVLGPMPLHHLLEGRAQLRAVLAGPEGLQHEGQLLGDFALGAVLFRVELVPPGQVVLVLIKNEVFGEDVCVRYALDDGVNEAGVAVVAEARDAGNVVGAPRLEPQGGHAVVVPHHRYTSDVLSYLVDDLSERGRSEHLSVVPVAVVLVIRGVFRFRLPLGHPYRTYRVPWQSERTL